MNGNMASRSTTMMSVIVLVARLARMSAVFGWCGGPFMVRLVYLTHCIGHPRCTLCDDGYVQLGNKG